LRSIKGIPLHIHPTTVKHLDGYNCHFDLPIVSTCSTSVRWFTNGMFTSDAGVHWSSMPGWRSDVGLIPVDSMTAFSYRMDPASNKIDLWKLDLSWWHPAVNDTFPQPVDTNTHSFVTNEMGKAPIMLSIFPNPASNELRVYLPGILRMYQWRCTMFSVIKYE